jgi:hypothetical protein
MMRCRAALEGLDDIHATAATRARVGRLVGCRGTIGRLRLGFETLPGEHPVVLSALCLGEGLSFEVYPKIQIKRIWGSARGCLGAKSCGSGTCNSTLWFKARFEKATAHIK